MLTASSLSFSPGLVREAHVCAILREIEGCGHAVAHLARFAQQTKKKKETAGIYTRLCKLCKKNECHA